jgi:cardiolipin synthase
MSGFSESQGRRRRARDRLRAGLRRHGLIPRPAELRRRLRARDLHFTRGNALELFRDGASGLAAMRAAIAAARHRVHLETYILRSDATGLSFLAALEERARAGVEVRVLFDAVGSRGIDPEALEPLRRAGADVLAFNPLSRLYPHWAPRRRDHRKILVVDGRVAFTGGLNLGDEYAEGADFGHGRTGPWRDVHVRVEGPAVGLLEAVFVESWFRADGPDRPWTELHGPGPVPGGQASVAVIPDGPTYHRRRMRELLMALLEGARERAQFATPYFVPGRGLRAALRTAVERGVEVELLIAGASDHPMLRWAAHALLPPLVERGVRVHEFATAMMHAKAAVFDGHVAVLGTSNLDRQSLEHSYEVNLVVEGGGLPADLSRLLAEDAASSPQLSLEVLVRRSWLRRARDRLAAFLLRRI